MKPINELMKRNPREIAHSGSFSDFPIRRKGKKTRFFTENEYLSLGYARSLSKHATLTYLVLEKYANAKTQACFPSMETIMKEGGICNKRYVSKGIKELEKYGIIFVNRPQKRGSNIYHLLDTSVWKKLPGFPMNNGKSDTLPGKNELADGVEFDTVSHISNSNNEIKPKEIRYTRKDIEKYILTFNSFCEKEDNIFMAISEIAKDGVDLSDATIASKLRQLSHEQKIRLLKIPW